MLVLLGLVKNATRYDDTIFVYWFNQLSLYLWWLYQYKYLLHPQLVLEAASELLNLCKESRTMGVI